MTDAAGSRPTVHLPITHLLRLSAYWLGLTAIDSAVNLFVQYRVNFGGLVDEFSVGSTLAIIGLGGALIGIVVQPTVGAISDYFVSRWGRRKPFIVVGSLLDVVFLVAIANSNTVLALAVFVMLLAFTTNLARGPFQGYVPDLVAEPQVGIASAMVGLMQVLGNVVGFALVLVASETSNLPLALILVAIVELVTMISVVWRVGPGLPPKPREGRSWTRIARETWATDILQERSYVWMLASRLFFLMGGGVLFNLIVTYLKQSHGLAQNRADDVNTVLLVVIAIANVLVLIPSARISDRVGRKPVIYASCLVGGVGIAITALAPTIEIAIIGGALFGASAGIFLAVDWALMTDLIPKASAGRYMGLSNVVTGSSSLFAVASGGIVIDVVNRAAGFVGPGPRAAFLLGLVYYIIAAFLLRPVVEPRRGRRREIEAAANIA